MSDTQERIDKLEERLNNGFLRIGAAMRQGIAVERWEQHWIMLLREYERLSDELAAAPMEQAAMPGLPRVEGGV